MKIDLNKKYRYRDGKPARVLCVDAPGDYSVISMLPDGDILRHGESGAYYSEGNSSRDLIEVREPLECWVRVATAGNAIHSEGTAVAIQREDSREPTRTDHWKVVKFREVIE